MRNYASIGMQIPDILLPASGVDLSKWAVVACDQYTAEPKYWIDVEDTVGNAPSTLHIVFPEVYLETPGKEERIQKIQERMREYLSRGILAEHEAAVYVERTVHGKTRKGLVVCVDLEHYDHRKGSTTLIRATEGTILERLPPRMKIREGALLESPHIMVLIDDPKRTVIEPIAANRQKLEKLYEFELMEKGGRLAGYKVARDAEETFVRALERLASPGEFRARYGFEKDMPVLLFAMGDGNHSLATAKAVWDKVKDEKGPNHPARYALVELVNLHDEALQFEPIHRVLFELRRDIFAEMKNHYGRNFGYEKRSSQEAMISEVSRPTAGRHKIGVVREGECGVLAIESPSANLPVGTLQSFLDGFVKDGGCRKIDYVHGADVVAKIGSEPGNVGFYLPAMDKADLFKTVILDGVLPRKTFSMGEANEKRFYVECRKIL